MATETHATRARRSPPLPAKTVDQPLDEPSSEVPRTPAPSTATSGALGATTPPGPPNLEGGVSDALGPRTPLCRRAVAAAGRAAAAVRTHAPPRAQAAAVRLATAARHASATASPAAATPADAARAAFGLALFWLVLGVPAPVLLGVWLLLVANGVVRAVAARAWGGGDRRRAA